MFKFNTRDRLNLWKNFRNELDSISFSEALVAVTDFWSLCPFTPYYLDPDEAITWPDPWQLITENYYCDLAKALAMLYTLHLTKHKSKLDPEIRIYYDTLSRHRYHIVYLCQGKYVLNLIEGQVVNKEHINQELKLIRCYTASDLKLEQY